MLSVPQRAATALYGIVLFLFPSRTFYLGKIDYGPVLATLVKFLRLPHGFQAMRITSDLPRDKATHSASHLLRLADTLLTDHPVLATM